MGSPQWTQQREATLLASVCTSCLCATHMSEYRHKLVKTSRRSCSDSTRNKRVPVLHWCVCMCMMDQLNHQGLGRRLHGGHVTNEPYHDVYVLYHLHIRALSLHTDMLLIVRYRYTVMQSSEFKALSRCSTSTLIRHFAHEKPDFMVIDPMAFGAANAADKYDVPYMYFHTSGLPLPDSWNSFFVRSSLTQAPVLMRMSLSLSGFAIASMTVDTRSACCDAMCH
jgi:hypothetical protein